MTTYHNELEQALQNLGISIPVALVPGQFIRFSTNGKPRDRAGWAFTSSDYSVAVIGDWRTDEKQIVFARDKRTLSRKERREQADALKLARRTIREERRKRYAAGAERAQTLFRVGAPLRPDHPYLRKKGIGADYPWREATCETVTQALGYQPRANGEPLTGRIILAPIMSIEDKVTSIEMIDEDGRKCSIKDGARRGNFWSSRPLPHGTGDGIQILIGEGIATAITATEAVPCYAIAASSCGNLVPVVSALRQRFPLAAIVVLGERGNGADKAIQAASEARCEVVFPTFSELAPTDLSDFNDMAGSVGLEAVRKVISSALSGIDSNADVSVVPPQQQGGQPALPTGYRWTESGCIEFRSQPGRKDDGDTWTRLISPIRFVAKTRDEGQRGWGLWLKVQTPDRALVDCHLLNSQLAGTGERIVAELLNCGAALGGTTAARQALIRLFHLLKFDKRALTVGRVGWHGATFVLPDRSYGDDTGEQILYDGSNAKSHGYKFAGSLQSWQDEIAALAVGNSRIVLALSVGFAGPLLRPLGLEGGGLHLRGQSSFGKTTVLALGASIFGGGGERGMIVTWRSTDNGLEGIALRHNDLVLCLDEMSEADGKTVGKSAFMLINGSGKQRANKFGEARTSAEWRIMVLSTGEISLADKMMEERQRITAGQDVRLLDIAADAGAGLGIFEELHGHQSAASLADHLRDAAGSNFGHAGHAYLTSLTKNQEKATLFAKMVMGEWLQENQIPGDNGQVRRAAHRFALIAAAGELATAHNVVPWEPGEARRATAVCFQAWLEGRGGTQPSEVLRGIANVRNFIERHGPSRFANMDDPNNANVRNRAGFRSIPIDEHGNVTGATTYYIFPDAFREACDGVEAKLVARALADLDIAKTDSENKTSVSLRLPDGGGKRRVYQLCFADEKQGHVD